MQNSISTKEAEIISRDSATQVSIGIECPAEYGLFIEYGTGVKGDPEIPHTSKEKWVYFNERKQEFRTGYPLHPRPFMRPALFDHISVYKMMIAEGVAGAWDE